MKQWANKHRSKRSFDVGDCVFLRLQLYKQISLKKAKKDNKLSPKYYDPYKVFQNIVTMAYKLELPTSSQVHPVFHVSCLKKVIGDQFTVQIISRKLQRRKLIYTTCILTYLLYLLHISQCQNILERNLYQKFQCGLFEACLCRSQEY